MKLAFRVSCFMLALIAVNSGYAQNVVVENKTDSLGQKQGKWMEYFPNGNIKSITYYKNNKTDSIYKSFYSSGKIESEIYFNDGVINGTYTLYYENGVMSDLDMYYLGQPVWTSKFDKEGYLVMEEIYLDGKLYSIIHYKKGKFYTKGSVKQN